MNKMILLMVINEVGRKKVRGKFHVNKWVELQSRKHGFNNAHQWNHSSIINPWGDRNRIVYNVWVIATGISNEVS